MKVSFKIDGFDSIGRKLDRMVAAVEGVEAEGLQGEAEMILARMQELVPVDQGDLRASLGIKRSNRRLELMVGPIGPAAWRAHFTEFGTIKETAQPFIRPAFDEMAPKLKKSAARRLEAAIRKSVKG